MRESIAIWFLLACLRLGMLAQSPPIQPATQPGTKQAPAVPVASEPSPVNFPLDQFKEFSAIMIGSPIPGTEDEIHIYRSGNLMRMEANGGKSYQITDLEKGETHGVAKGGCLLYASPYIRSYPFSFSNPANKFGRVTVGKETVDGHTCQVEDVTITLPNHPQPATIRLWEAEDLQGFPVKVETRTHQVIRYKNVVLGAQDPTLFIFPDVCQVAEQTVGKRP
jgi:hypothetical protein